MRNIIVVLCLLSSLLSIAQNKNYPDTRNMKTFDIKRYEENKGNNKEYADKTIYIYTNAEGWEVRQYGYETGYSREYKYFQEITKENDPHFYQAEYFSDGTLGSERFIFNESLVLMREYDRSGKLIKETDNDKKYKHNFEQIRELVLKEKGINIYDTRQAEANRIEPGNYSLSYRVVVMKITTFPSYSGRVYSRQEAIDSFYIDDKTGKFRID